jgi:hypothetical protein
MKATNYLKISRKTFVFIGEFAYFGIPLDLKRNRLQFWREAAKLAALLVKQKRTREQSL